MALLRILVIIFAIVLVFRLIARPLTRYLFGQMEKKMNSTVQDDSIRPEGEIRIERAEDNNQEFSDYEEIK